MPYGDLVEHFRRKRDRYRHRARATRNPLARKMYRWCADRCEVQRKEAILARFVREGQLLQGGERRR